MAETDLTFAHDPGWLKSRAFDLAFIRGIALLAVGSGLIVVMSPNLLVPVLLLDFWLLGYHHVVSTFTRLAFDAQNIRTYRFFVFGLPPIVFGVTFLLAFSIGVWSIATLYLYWQWFHYTRQSWGISKAYDKKAGGQFTRNRLWSGLTFYLVPTYGILYRSWQAPDQFLFQELRVIAVPELMVDIAGIAALISVTAWLATQVLAWQQGTLARAHAYYMLSHFTIFLIGYRLIDDITQGWLVINIWHNAQYIMFVWMFNNKRFQSGVDPSARLISWLSQSGNKLVYLAVCLGISTIVYAGILALAKMELTSGIPFAVLVYQTINFHHYIVDSMIWKLRKAPLQKTLEI